MTWISLSYGFCTSWSLCAKSLFFILVWSGLVGSLGQRPLLQKHPRTQCHLCVACHRWETSIRCLIGANGLIFTLNFLRFPWLGQSSCVLPTLANESSLWIMLSRNRSSAVHTQGQYFTIFISKAPNHLRVTCWGQYLPEKRDSSPWSSHLFCIVYQAGVLYLDHKPNSGCHVTPTDTVSPPCPKKRSFHEHPGGLHWADAERCLVWSKSLHYLCSELWSLCLFT